MPYIKENDRWELNMLPDDDSIETSGELNFLFTQLCNQYLRDHGLSYQTCNDIVGALDNAKDEFKRRIQDPYEDMKRLENGDVYDKEFRLTVYDPQGPS